MIPKIKISDTQTVILTALVIMGGQILFIPFYLAQIAHQDSWIGAIIGMFVGFIIIIFYSTYAKKFPNMSFSEVNEKLVGKFIGTFITLIFYLYYFVLICLMSRDVVEFIKIQMLIETPLFVLLFLFIFIVVMGARLGLETIARAAEICFPYMILLFFVLIVFSIPGIRIENFQPVFESGIKDITNSVIQFQFFTYLQLILFFTIFPFLEGSGKRKQPFLVGGAIGGLILIMLTTLCIGVIGDDLLILEMYPSYLLAQKIFIGDFITRIEVLIAGIWFITLYFKTTLFFYVLSLGTAQMFKLNDYRSLTTPLGIIVLVYSLVIYPNTVYYRDSIPYWNSLVITIGLVIPVIMFFISKLRKI